MIYDGTVLPFFQSAQKLSIEDQSRLSVRFVGGLPLQEQNWLNDNSLGWQISVTGRVSHTQAINEMRKADILLLPIGSDSQWEGHYPGKLFEYMKSGTPIFLISPEGDAACLISESGTGCFVNASNLDEIAKNILIIVNNSKQFVDKYYHPHHEIISRYERRFLTSRLADIFVKSI